ncbi:hypothetical protein [Micromonospora sp. DT229]|uniref:hypothetical protein n=1 Tax=Micromonospora sp. DT229 TaxID=3393430 RepID=UPI003CF398FB
MAAEVVVAGAVVGGASAAGAAVDGAGDALTGVDAVEAAAVAGVVVLGVGATGALVVGVRWAGIVAEAGAAGGDGGADVEPVGVDAAPEAAGDAPCPDGAATVAASPSCTSGRKIA